MNKQLLILIAFISSVLLFSLKTNAQVCQNLDAGDDVQMQCTDTDVTLQANVIAPNYKTTRNYDISNEPLCPSIVYDGSRSNIQTDDEWSNYVIDIPFTFCFFENQYDQLLISGNGIVTFDLTVLDQYSSWVVADGLQLPTQEWQTNAIFGVYHDMDTSVQPRVDRISYKTLGVAPNRVFVISFEAYQFSCNDLLSKSQIMLYESSNVIDIRIDEKPVCSGWNGGRAVVGIQNKSGTIGVAPPNRNNGVWTPAAGGELWRFIPNGQDMEYHLNWYDQDGNQINANNEETIIVTPQETTTYTAELTLVDQCDDSTAVLTDQVTVTPGFTPNILNPVDMTECESPAGSGTFPFNIDQTTYILNGLNPADFNISYHTSFADAQANINPITVLNPYVSASGTIYVRVEDVNDATCATIREFQLTTISQDSAFFYYSQYEYCIYDANPIPNPGFVPGGLFSVDIGIIDPITGELDLNSVVEGNDYIVTHYLSGFCEDTKQQIIHINESPIATMPTTILNSCNNGDGTANFDITSIENEIIGNQNDVVVSYFENQTDAELGTNELETVPFLVASGNIWVRVENTFGCYAVTEVPLIIEDCVVIIPQGFSPNSNIPENQTFYIPLIRTKYPKFEIHIYNRYGNEVYNGNVNTDDWNGKMDNKGDLLPAGTYFYGIKANDEDDIRYRGWVYLNY